jgi:hypothetical protein
LGEGELDTFLVDFVAQLDESGAAVDCRAGDAQRIASRTGRSVDDDVKTAQGVVPGPFAQWTGSRSRTSFGVRADRGRRRTRRDAAGRARRVRP